MRLTVKVVMLHLW